MLLSPSEIGRLVGITSRMVNHHVRTGRFRAIVVNGRYKVDSDTVMNQKLGKYKNALVTRDVPHWRALTGLITQHGPAALAPAYLTLSEADRQLLDSWCESRSIESPNHYI